MAAGEFRLRSAISPTFKNIKIVLLMINASRIQLSLTQFAETFLQFSFNDVLAEQSALIFVIPYICCHLSSAATAKKEFNQNYKFQKRSPYCYAIITNVLWRKQQKSFFTA